MVGNALSSKTSVCPRPPFFPTLAAARGLQNSLTRNFVLRAAFCSTFFSETSAKVKIAFLPSPSAALQPPLRGFGKKAIRGASHLLRAPESFARPPAHSAPSRTESVEPWESNFGVPQLSSRKSRFVFFCAHTHPHVQRCGIIIPPRAALNPHMLF